MGDAYRGRVFAFYDMMFNAAYVAGAALSVAVMPEDGRHRSSSPWWRRATPWSRPPTGWPPGRGQPSSDGSGGEIPSAAAQSSSS